MIGKLSGVQVWQREQFQQMGCDFRVIYGMEQAKEFIKELKEGIQVSEELQEVFISDWSDYDPGDHEEIKRIIKNNINSVCANYVAIGFYLNVVNDKKLFQDDGYSGIGDYAKAEYGIEKDKCSYLMKIARRFCIPNSPALLPEYRGFRVEKLRAMVYLSDEQLEQVSITTTRAEIRNMKKPEPEKVEPAQLEAEPEKIEPTQPEAKGLILDCYNPEEGWNKELILDEAESDQSESIKKYDKAKGILDHLMNEEWCSLVIWRRFLEKDIAKKGKEEACKNFLSFHGGHGQALKAENGHPKFEFILHRSYGNTPGKIELQWDNDKVEMPTDEFMDLYLRYSVGGKEVQELKKSNWEAGVFEDDREAYGAFRAETVSQLFEALHDRGLSPADLKTEEIHFRVWAYAYFAEQREADYITFENEDSGKDFRVAYQRLVNEFEWFKQRHPNKDDIPDPVNDTPEIVDNQAETVNDVEDDIIPEKGCHNCNYNDMTPEEIKAIDPGGGIPCNICDDKLDQWMPMAAVTESDPKTDFPCDTCGHNNYAGCCDYDTENDWCEMGSAWIPKKQERENTREAMKCDTCGYDEDGQCEYPSHDIDDQCLVGEKWIPKEEGQVETVEADIVQTVPEEDELDDGDEEQDPEAYTVFDIDSEMTSLMQWLEEFRKDNSKAPARRKSKMRWDAICLLDKQVREANIPKDAKPELQTQPELPILRNNDQRKAFIEAYETWPIWIDLEQTGERYYRYDISDAVAMVVKVSRKHAWKSYNETKDYEYGAEQYYLLGVKTSWSANNKSAFILDDTRTFYECNTNKSMLAEYLKDLQKKGA